MTTYAALLAAALPAFLLVPPFASDAPNTKVAKEDMAYLSFGKVIKAAAQERLDWKSPHQVTAHAVWMCSHGKSRDLIEAMGHVQEDAQLGEAFLDYIAEFGPDLERYKDKEVYLRFHGYVLTGDTSIWYYWLTDRAGNNLEHSPWVSTRRSRRTGRCAMTGIFPHDPDIEGSPGPMPDGLVTSRD